MFVPELVQAYNVYGDNSAFLGVTDELTLPNFEPQSSTIAGAGIMGEIEAVNDGHFSSQEITIPFRLLTREGMNLMEPGFHDITLRASTLSSDESTKELFERPLKIVIRGRNKKLEPGKIKQSEGMETKVTLEIYYIKIEENGETLLESSKTDNIYVVNGKDYYAGVRRNI